MCEITCMIMGLGFSGVWKKPLCFFNLWLSNNSNKDIKIKNDLSKCAMIMNFVFKLVIIMTNFSPKLSLLFSLLKRINFKQLFLILMRMLLNSPTNFSQLNKISEVFLFINQPLSRKLKIIRYEEKSSKFHIEPRTRKMNN